MGSATPSPVSVRDRLIDGSGGAIATLRELFANGAFEVITPPARGPDADIDAKTLVQIDGDVVTLIRDPALLSTLDEHFARVRHRLDALDRLRNRFLATLSAPPIIVGLWNGVAVVREAIALETSIWQSLWQLVWPRGAVVIVSAACLMALPWFVRLLLGRLITVGKKRLFQAR